MDLNDFFLCGSEMDTESFFSISDFHFLHTYFDAINKSFLMNVNTIYNESVRIYFKFTMEKQICQDKISKKIGSWSIRIQLPIADICEKNLLYLAD
jgi:hypothetical protein